MDYFVFELLKQLINGIGLILSLISDRAAAVGFVLIYDKLVIVIFIDTKSPRLFIIDADKESRGLRRRKLPVFVPFFQLFYGAGLFVTIMMGRIRCTARGALFQIIFICISATLKFINILNVKLLFAVFLYHICKSLLQLTKMLKSR